MTELGQVEIKKRLLSGVVDCELLSDTYDLISALQAEILELKADKVVLQDEVNRNVKLHPCAEARQFESKFKNSVTIAEIKPRMYKSHVSRDLYKTKSERDDD